MRLVDDLARLLKRAGLTSGDRVALRAASNAEFVVGLLAASRADLVVVPLDPALPVSEQRDRSEAAGARVVLVDGPDGQGAGDKTEPMLRWWPIAVTAQQATVEVTLDAATAPKHGVSKPEGLRDDDAMIMFTGGRRACRRWCPGSHEHRQISPGHHRRLRARPAGCDRRGDAALPRPRADRRAAVHPGFGRDGAATGPRTVLGAHLLGRHRAVQATWYTAVPTIHQILLERAKTSRPRTGGPHCDSSAAAALR